MVADRLAGRGPQRGNPGDRRPGQDRTGRGPPGLWLRDAPDLCRYCAGCGYRDKFRRGAFAAAGVVEGKRLYYPPCSIAARDTWLDRRERAPADEAGGYPGQHVAGTGREYGRLVPGAERGLDRWGSAGRHGSRAIAARSSPVHIAELPDPAAHRLGHARHAQAHGGTGLRELVGRPGRAETAALCESRGLRRINACAAFLTLRTTSV